MPDPCRTTDTIVSSPRRGAGRTVHRRYTASLREPRLPQAKTPPERGFPPIGETGFEPATARPPAGCATRLRHSPWHPERATGIEPALEAWKASVQPQHFARKRDQGYLRSAAPCGAAGRAQARRSSVGTAPASSVSAGG